MEDKRHILARQSRTLTEEEAARLSATNTHAPHITGLPPVTAIVAPEM